MFGWPSLLNPYLSGEFTATGTLPAYLGGEFDPVTHVQGVSYRNWLPGGQNSGMRNLDKALLV